MKQLLLVDDDEAFRNRLAGALEKRGWPVLMADDASTALAAVGADGLSGAIVDLHLRGLSGLRVVGALRAASESLRIVVLTGFGSIATALEAVRLGANDYLTKPSDPDTILCALLGERTARESSPAAVAVPSLDRVEWEHIQRVLTECEGNISKTARLLRIDRRSLQRKLGKYPPNR
jgi:two-component system response regulator RegA